MAEVLHQIIARNRAGHRAAIPSVCSAHPVVLRAALMQAEALDRPIVIEATSNQVNHEGGYTGMTPTDFANLVRGIAQEAGTDMGRVILGGDHLGPQAWRHLPAPEAMARATRMVQDYAAAGFAKIHLDCAEPCTGDPDPLGDGLVAARSAELARVAAAVAPDVLFVIGTEVPPPGGLRAGPDHAPHPTAPLAAAATLQAHVEAFGPLAPQIGGLVVQPGVEFGPDAVHALPMDRDPGLLTALADHPGVCLEAHSTDYQQPEVYPRLAELGFAFQKVGPALTHAYRRALYRLDALDGDRPLQAMMEQVMRKDPRHWAGHYDGTPGRQYWLRHHSLADRIRYYWPLPQAQSAVQDLMQRAQSTLTPARVAADWPEQVVARAETLHGPLPQRLVEAEIQLALDPYFFEEAA